MKWNKVKTIIVPAYGDLSAHVISIDIQKAREILSLQESLQRMPESVHYLGVAANVYPLDYLDVDPEKEHALRNGILEYIMIDGDSFGLSKGLYPTGYILVSTKKIVTAYENSESGDISELIRSIANSQRKEEKMDKVINLFKSAWWLFALALMPASVHRPALRLLYAMTRNEDLLAGINARNDEEAMTLAIEHYLAGKGYDLSFLYD
ncbi:MAG: hypothetical protein N2255_02605 [Kiritimatiellae bacterium]|nr:hypothetical protein [Kiritimatiellia bacterium]